VGLASQSSLIPPSLPTISSPPLNSLASVASSSSAKLVPIEYTWRAFSARVDRIGISRHSHLHRRDQASTFHPSGPTSFRSGSCAFTPSFLAQSPHSGCAFQLSSDREYGADYCTARQRAKGIGRLRAFIPLQVNPITQLSGTSYPVRTSVFLLQVMVPRALPKIFNTPRDPQLDCTSDPTWPSIPSRSTPPISLTPS